MPAPASSMCPPAVTVCPPGIPSVRPAGNSFVHPGQLGGEMGEDERKQQGIRSLPEDLFEAIGAAGESKLLREVLGEHVHEYLLRSKREEWDLFKSYVSPMELERYLPIL